MSSYDWVFINATLLIADGTSLSSGALVVHDGLIEWVGAEKDLPASYLQNAKRTQDCQGQLITPGLIDCHTHLVYAGNRAQEFQLKLDGVSYADIAKSGGGIVATVKQTRAASEEQLFAESLLRLLALRDEGVTTVEIKSGYGLSVDSEIKMLKVARQLGQETGVRIKTTFLGAHAVPEEYKGRTQEYVDYICQQMLPQVAELGLADAVDVFCESIGFTLEQTEQIFIKAQDLNLPVKCHADQLSNLGASTLASQFKALSCDHLEFLDEAGAKALADAGTVAVLLPGAYYFLREARKPPIEWLRKAGVKMAVATDCNPGSSPTASLRLMMSMACQLFQLRVPEVLAAVTSHAAQALGLSGQIGALSVGASADIVLWSLQEPASLCYYFAYPIPHQTMIGGKWLG